MKKTNKKGFTLIELLAVIIILGVLMIIAIPSVTEYISSSRKSAFADSAVSYIDGTRTMVNQAQKVQFFDVNTLYLVPVGHEEESSCVSLEKGGASPYSDTWEYAYVGVTYNGTSYNYYFIAKDSSNQGINFVSQEELADKTGDLVVSGSNELRTYDVLKTQYAQKTTDKIYLMQAPDEGEGEVWTEPTTADSVKGIAQVITDAEGKTISQIEIVAVDNCK